MKLFIVESPKKAKTIKKFLTKDYYLLASYGHIIDLPVKEFGIYLKNEKIVPKYVVKNKRFVHLLKKLSKLAEEIILATDPDREGEFIAWSISQYLQNKKFYRIRFFEISPKAIIEALKNKDKINNFLVKSQQARRFLDRIIGYSLSPILWQEKIGESAGRVQSAALRLIVEREEEIKNFVSEDYYELVADFGKFQAKYFEYPGIMLFKDKEYLEKIKKEINEDYFVLDKKETKKKILLKPSPIDTALLQRIAFLKFRYSSFLTMKIAQSLYEQGLITYHRTDSFYLSEEFLKEVKNLIGDYFDYPKRKKSKFAQEAHEAIRPVYLKRKIENLNLNEKNLYQLIFDYTLSACSKNALVEVKDYCFKVKDFLFKSEGERLVYDGYLKFFPFPIKFKELPELRKGEKLKPVKLEIRKKTTQPPPRYSESTLIKKMKELGLGRPSTYANIIKILYQRKYVIKEKNYLKPTLKGERVIKFLKEKFAKVVDFKFTAEMEENLDKIALGKLDLERFIINTCRDLELEFK